MKMKPVQTRKAWSIQDKIEIVALYDYFLQQQLNGTKYQKAKSVRKLAEKQGRSKGSIECKLMNISACRQDIGLVFVTGYKPLKNYEHDLLNLVKFNTKFLRVA